MIFGNLAKRWRHRALCSLRQVLRPKAGQVLSQFNEGDGKAWLADLPHLRNESDGLDRTVHSRLVLFEDGKPLGPSHVLHDAIARSGAGRYSHWDNYLIFSTSDNSDPRTNGRTYTIKVADTFETPDYPHTMHLNLSHACNLNCQICRPPDFRQTSAPATLSEDIIDKVSEEVFPHLHQLRIDSSGEPLLAKTFPRVVQAASRRKLPIHLQTNGMLLNAQKSKLICDSSINSVCISLDSPNKETLEWIRTGSNFETIVQNARKLVQTKHESGRDDLSILFHAALLKQNLSHLCDLLRLAHSLGLRGVSCALGYIHSYMDPNWSVYWDRLQVNQVLDEARVLAANLNICFSGPSNFDMGTTSPDTEKPALGGTCAYLYTWSYIDPSGAVFPCCVGNFEVGNLGKTSFGEIWRGETYERLRLTHNTDNPLYFKCKNCYLRDGWKPSDWKSLFHPDHWDFVRRREGCLNNL
jgi:radical SAM protein with 4Fe4S-binding SPASM domain